MKTSASIISSGVWTALLLFLYRTPIGSQDTDWRLPLFLFISWVLGLVLIAFTVRGRKMDTSREFLITVDANTGLANRRAFRGHVEPLLKAAVRFTENNLVMILSINNLDRIIEEEGDEEAELVVFHVAQAFLSSLRASDILARYEKDELVAFLPKATMDFSDIVTERIKKNIATRGSQINGLKKINVSIGYAQFDPVAPNSLDYLLKQAYDDMIRNMGESGIEQNKETKVKNAPRAES